MDKKIEKQSETQVAPKNETQVAPKNETGRIRIRQLPERPLGLIQGN